MTASHPRPEVPAVDLRPPSEVMRLARMGSFFATRLSFMRVLIRELMTGGWKFDRPRFDLDAGGFGTAVYRVARPGRAYSLVAFSHDLAPDMRTDRVIAEAWDATFVLFDGEPGEADIRRLRANVPRQEAGRFHATEIVLCRANKSLRFFEHLAARLAAGQQPDPALVRDVGYLMRTTAVYGNGKFGIADRARIAARPELAGPFQAEMLAVYLVRLFTLDLVEHVAQARAPATCRPLDPRIRRYLGIGNATGLGMAPFLMTHPKLLSNWMLARETALARARAAPLDRQRLAHLLDRAMGHVDEWQVADPRQAARIATLRLELPQLALQVPAAASADALHRWAGANVGLEAQELLASLLIELVPDLVDGLARDMAADEWPMLDGAMRVGDALAMIRADYAWALAVDCSDRRQRAQFWYVSEEKLEPRLGRRDEEPGSDRERPFAIPLDMQALATDLAAAPQRETVAEFLMRHPRHRHSLRRAQIVHDHPYGEIRDNLVGADCLPIDILRCKLSFFGAAKFDPKSSLWTRITMFQGAPLPHELADPAADDWGFPSL